MRIVTLTLNPVFDLHCFAEKLALYRENFLKSAPPQAAGKGINLSRALLSKGIQSEAVVIVGRENAEPYIKALKDDNLDIKPVFTEGRIRENITIHEEHRPETRICFDGFCADQTVLDEIRRQIGDVDKDTVIAFTGSVCKGINIDDVLGMLSEFKKSGAKIVIDSRSVSLDRLVKFGPWLIKPNEEEAEKYTGNEIKDIDDALNIAKELHHAGISNAMITLGGKGAVLASDGGVLYAEAPKVEALSTIGAGDSTVAGFIEAAMCGLGPQDCLRRAVAFGTAACLREGTLPPKSEDIEIIEKKITLRNMQ